MQKFVLHKLAHLLCGAFVLLPLAYAQTESTTFKSIAEINIPPVELSGDVLYKLLAVDFAVSRGESYAGIETLLELARSTQDPRLVLRALELALQTGNVVQALTATDLMLELDPNNMQMRHVLSDLNKTVRNTPDLGEVLRKNIAQVSDKEKITTIKSVQRIVSLLEPGSIMIGTATEALQDVLDVPEALVVLAFVHGYSKQPQEGIAQAERALVLKPGFEDAAEVRLLLGLTIDVEQAIQKTTAFLSAYPQSYNLELVLAKVFAQYDKNDEGIALLTGLQERYPDKIEPLYILAALHIKQGDLASAEGILLKASQMISDASTPLVSTKDEVSVLTLLADVYEGKGDYERALATLKGVPPGKDKLSALIRESRLLNRLGREEEALALLDSLKQDAGVDEYLVAQAYASMFINKDRFADAINVYEDFIKKEPYRVTVMNDLGILYTQIDDLESAETWFRRAITLSPEYAAPYNALGYTLADKNIRLGEARELIAKALELSPNTPGFVDSLGWVAYREGNLDEALTLLEQAYRDDQHLEIALHYVEVLWLKGLHERAREVLNEYSDSSLNPTDLALKLALIKRLGI